MKAYGYFTKTLTCRINCDIKTKVLKKANELREINFTFLYFSKDILQSLNR